MEGDLQCSAPGLILIAHTQTKSGQIQDRQIHVKVESIGADWA